MTVNLFLLALCVMCYGISRENWHYEPVRVAFRGMAGVFLLLLSISLLSGG
jgi:hypothetical protein